MYIYYIHTYIYIENVITETTHFPSQPQNIYSYSLLFFFIIFDFPAQKEGKDGCGAGE